MASTTARAAALSARYRHQSVDAEGYEGEDGEEDYDDDCDDVVFLEAHDCELFVLGVDWWRLWEEFGLDLFGVYWGGICICKHLLATDLEVGFVNWGL
jgi:hypothetical protein